MSAAWLDPLWPGGRVESVALRVRRPVDLSKAHDVMPPPFSFDVYPVSYTHLTLPTSDLV